MKTPAAIIPLLLAGGLACWPAPTAFAADAVETNAAITAVKAEEAVSTQDDSHAFVQLQEQPLVRYLGGVLKALGVSGSAPVRPTAATNRDAHATQPAIEPTRQEADAAVTRNSETTAAQLQLIQDSLSSQRAREFDALQNANHLMLVLGGTIACLGCLAMVFTAWLQWRSTGRLTDLAANLSAGRALEPGWDAPGPAADEVHFAVEAPPETNSPLSGALERLEQRILELEHAAAPPLKDVAQNGVDSTAATPDATSAVQSEPAARITLLLGKGQALLNLDQTDEAMVCFDEVLTLDQNNTDALVKKGVALERQRKLDEAIECYDRAIAADGSVAIAYLYKGGICNRLERFSEALECYEHALRAQEKGRAS